MNRSRERRCKAGPALVDSLSSATPDDRLLQKKYPHTFKYTVCTHELYVHKDHEGQIPVSIIQTFPKQSNSEGREMKLAVEL